MAANGANKGNTPWPADRREERPIESLVPNARNARTHSQEQIEQIAALMQEFGWTNPVLVDEADNIIAGHGRVLAGQMNGYTVAPVAVAVGWTDAQKRAYAIADNKLPLNASWNSDLLAAELAAIGDYAGMVGFTTKELEALLGTAPGPDDFQAFDESIETEHQCPRCGYRWSGKADAGGALETVGEGEDDRPVGPDGEPVNILSGY